MKLSSIYIFENLASKMPLLIQTVEGINQKAQKQNKLILPLSSNISFHKIMKRNKLNNFADLVTYINQFDPTGSNAKYTQWLIKIIASGQLNIPEDGERITKTLKIFNKIKNSTKIDINKDINKYTNFRELETIVNKYNITDDDGPVTVRQWEDWIKKQGMTEIYEDNKYSLVRYDLTGTKITVFPNSIGQYDYSWIPIQFAPKNEPEKIAKAADVDAAALAVSKLACNTSYCVVNPHTAKGYLDEGPLYILYKDGAFYLLANATWSQFRNTQDISIKNMSPQLAFFISKVILQHSDKLTNIKILAYHIARAVEKYNITNEKALNIMKQAIEFASTHN